MIPLRLYLRNFMSYGEPGEELAFDFHTACLCGDNGNGKSALLDAMTWALWGRAPRLDGTQAKIEEIIRRADGVNEALVEFEFAVDGERYRIVRRLKRGKSGASATLELAVLSPRQSASPSPAEPSSPLPNQPAADDSWRSLTGATNTDTQRALQALLGLDYHTFVMSSFLFQGRADAFTRAAPTERKEVLGRILRLDLYDDLAKRARDMSRECDGRARQLGQELERLESAAAREAECAQAAETTAAALKQAEQALAACETELSRARTRQAAAQAAAKALRRAEGALKQAAAQADSLARHQEDFRRRVERARAALADEEAVRAAVARLEQARRLDEEFSARRERAAQAHSDCQQARAAIAAERARLEAELRPAEAMAREARESARAAETLARQAAALEEQIRACAEAEVSLEASRKQLEQLQLQRVADAQAEKALRAELGEMAMRMQALAQAAARCPLCEQELSEELRSRLLSQARELASDRESSLAELKQAGEEAALLALQIETKIRAIQPHMARAGRLQTRLGELRQQQADAQAVAARADELDQRAAALRTTLETESFAADARRRLAECEAALAQVAYDAAEHQRARATIRGLAGVEQRLGALESARATLPADEEHLRQVSANLATAREALTSAERERDRLREQAADASPAAAALTQAESRRAAASSERDRLVTEQAALTARIAACRQARDEAARCRRERGAMEQDRIIYGELADAFGRQGVQALVIETVVPQLTEDANELLARMTGGRMQVNLVTQRERADGGAAETLEIQISDATGTRRYELYSGGEAFRVDFAVRVALARLLARRAGAKLQTLVVDEGFGTQDANARDRLVECINAIQQDFEKVIVVTHIDELKDAFQERVEITKDDAGSHIVRGARAAA
jgi:exonuclease SbcC